MSPTNLSAMTLLLAWCALCSPCKAEDSISTPLPSKYGKDDTLGALNNLSAKGVLDAVKLVKSGKVYSLAIVSDSETPAAGGRSLKVERLSGAKGDFKPDGTGRITAFDEQVTASMGVGTQMDGLAHIGVDHHYYNNIMGADLAKSNKLDFSALPPIVTRGVLIDMTKHFKKAMLAATDGFGRREIEAAAKEQGVTIRKGDVVLFHTGWMGIIPKDKKAYTTSEPGIVADGAQYLADLGVVAVGSDTVGLELLPGPRLMAAHQTLLAKNGVYILECIKTQELARDGVKEFLFVVAPPKIAGTVQMLINPVAIL